MRRRLALGLGLALGLALAGCRDSHRDGPAPPVAVGLRGAIVVEPPRLGVGEVVRVEITVVTPPDHRVRPVRPPGEIPGFELLDAEALPVLRDEGRWVHRTRIHARAREPGRFAWPATTVEIEPPEGDAIPLALEERPLEVASVERQFPERVEPFPLRPAPAEPADRGIALPFAVGALSTLLALAALAAVRRLRPKRLPPAAAATRPESGTARAWRSARASLEAAAERAGSDPVRAAQDASLALRGFLSDRFSLPARTLTTEELATLAAPLGVERHWPEILAELAELDAARFPPRRDPDAAALRSTIERARRLVAEVVPEARW